MLGSASYRQRRKGSPNDEGSHPKLSFMKLQRRRQRRKSQYDQHLQQLQQQHNKFHGYLALPVLLGTICIFTILNSYVLFEIKRERSLNHRHHDGRDDIVLRSSDENARLMEKVPGIDLDDYYDDKEPIYAILEQSGIPRAELDEGTRRELPNWSQIQRMYGKQPMILGLERCQDFVNSVDPTNSFYGVAGTFNSGTNLLGKLLKENCQLTKGMKVNGVARQGIRWQVPWGKHTPVKYRGKHVIRNEKAVPFENVLAIVTIRDPYRWLMSMCKNSYSVKWSHNKTHCPHLYAEEHHKLTTVRVRYNATTESFTSLPALYDAFYTDYLNAGFPRLIVRLEDLLFYGENTTRTICECGGGDMRHKEFRHIEASAKKSYTGHSSTDRTGLLEALIKYGRDDRTHGLTQSDLDYAKMLFAPKLMRLFHYKHPERSAI